MNYDERVEKFLALGDHPEKVKKFFARPARVWDHLRDECRECGKVLFDGVSRLRAAKLLCDSCAVRECVICKAPGRIQGRWCSVEHQWESEGFVPAFAGSKRTKAQE